MALLQFAEKFAPPQADWSPGVRAAPPSPIDLVLVTRMTHTFALALPADHPRTAEITEAGIEALRSTFSDATHRGWLSVPGAPRKRAYEHAFVLLATSTAVRSGHPAVENVARSLLTEALEVIDTHFWNEDLGVLRESFAADWTDDEPYVGGNSNMHAVEAYLAAAAATSDKALLARALRIADAIVHRHLQLGQRMLVEHFSPELKPLLQYNRDAPADALRPFGSTVGHWLEWSRLLVELDVALAEPPPWLIESATLLFDKALRLGWQADGHPGFVYTLDWTGAVSVDSRLHWVLAEAIAAASALHVRTGNPLYATRYDEFWNLAALAFLAPDGSWRHELACDLRPIRRVWGGRPDAYHASTALLAHRLRPSHRSQDDSD